MKNVLASLIPRIVHQADGRLLRRQPTLYVVTGHLGRPLPDLHIGESRPPADDTMGNSYCAGLGKG
jgi:hypothetical protein